MPKFLDRYDYCSNDKEDRRKRLFYENHIYTIKERKLAKALNSRVEEYIKIVHESELNELKNKMEAPINYIKKVGYIKIINADRSYITIYSYGEDEDEAFIEAIKEIELSYSIDYECEHREELNKEFSDRFLDGKYTENDYHGPFFFAEIALQDLRKYYKEEIPKELIDYYIENLRKIDIGDFKYDYQTNKIVKK